MLWQGRDPEWDEWDGGAFAKWMRACEDDEQQQRDSAPSLDGQAAASLHRSSSQALLGLRPQVHHSHTERSDLAANVMRRLSLHILALTNHDDSQR